MPVKKNKVVYIDDEEYVWCSNEQEYLVYTEFDFNRKGEYKQSCRNCCRIIYKERNMNYSKGAENRNLYVEEQTKIMLSSLGYDPNSTYSIHEQFLIKHKLI